MAVRDVWVIDREVPRVWEEPDPVQMEVCLACLQSVVVVSVVALSAAPVSCGGMLARLSGVAVAAKRAGRVPRPTSTGGGLLTASVPESSGSLTVRREWLGQGSEAVPCVASLIAERGGEPVPTSTSAVGASLAWPMRLDPPVPNLLLVMEQKTDGLTWVRPTVGRCLQSEVFELEMSISPGD